MLSNLESDRREHQEYPQGAVSMLRQRLLVYLYNHYATKGVL